MGASAPNHPLAGQGEHGTWRSTGERRTFLIFTHSWKGFFFFFFLLMHVFHYLLTLTPTGPIWWPPAASTRWIGVTLRCCLSTACFYYAQAYFVFVSASYICTILWFVLWIIYFIHVIWLNLTTSLYRYAVGEFHLSRYPLQHLPYIHSLKAGGWWLM